METNQRDGSFQEMGAFPRLAWGIVLIALLALIVGCGSGGYAGQGLTSLSASNATIDAGQSFSVSANDPGNLPLTWTLSGASCSGSSCGTVSSTSGTSTTYTAPSPLTAPITVTLQATVAGTQSNKTVAITVNPAPTINGATPNGTVGAPYSATLSASGGTGSLTLSLASGSLPSGLSFDPATGLISGTPTAAGTSDFVVQVTDKSDVPNAVTTSRQIIITTTAASLTASGTPPAGVVGTAYSYPLQAEGGTAPYTWAVTSGSLPAGLTLSTNGVISGTPTAAGSSTFTARVQDTTGAFATGTFTITVTSPGQAPLTISSTLPNGTVNVPYSATIGVSGGTAPYTCTVASGNLPAGLSLASGCVVSGTPTNAGTSTVTVLATDSSNPAKSVDAPVSLTIAPIGLNLGTGTLPSGTVNTPYSSTIPVNGGTTPYSCAITAGALPAGLTLGAGCLVSGTPTVPGNSTITVAATDSSNPAKSTSGPITITINPATVALTTSTLPNGTVGTPYNATVGVTGGAAPYTCSIVSGSLPAGLAFGAGCAVTGTPTVAGTSTPVVRATDSSNPTQSTTGPISVTINPAPSSIVIASPPPATVNTPYTGTVPVSGGTAPYTCSTTGTLPPGLVLGSNCQITGTPTATGSTTVTVAATDSSKPARNNSGPITITVNPGGTTLTIGAPPVATVSTPYNGTIPVTGGTGPYNCTVTAGALPAGLTLGAGCALSGTPTTAGTTNVGITATDSAEPTNTKTSTVPITVQPIQPLTLTGSLPNGTLNQPYTQTLQATGGVGPYTYAVTAGTLPAGLSLSTDGVISGTPTAVGASSFTVTATDSEGTPQTASLPLVLLITYPTTPNDALLNGPYAFLFQGYDDAVAGVLAYQTATAGSFTADGAGGVSTGELDSNHQASNPTGNTIASRNFLGSYTVGTDNRGALTITTLNADGTTNATTTYAIALRAPVAPATVASSGSLIEFDSDQLAGTKGTGTLLAQTSSAFAAGLNGSYAFGVTGDTPCLPACTVGLVAGQVAEVGQFTAAGGAITGGTGDTNVASTNFPNSALSGTYTASDGNGRVQLSLATSELDGTFYPTEFAVYLVDADHVFIISTDKHSAYILQAGTATLQTQPTFNDASLGAPFVGYENSPVNPGLVGATLQNVLNISTATIFRGTGNGNGTCTITNVDTGGTTGLVNSLTGLGSNSDLLNAVLGTYQSLGNSNCPVATNGRAVLNYPNPSNALSTTLGLLGLGNDPPPARVVYLISPNAGYFLETGYAGLGTLEAQTGAPFSTATLNGTFVYNTIPASTVATINSSGVFTADGAGHTTSTLDENVGVGTINVLQLGTTGADNYSLTDAVAGRYQLGASRVIYAIAPGRFVLLETEPLSTTPYIALLY